MSGRARRVLLERGGLVVLATLVLYVCLAAPYVVDGDNAEFAELGATGGVAHPSGYPLYVLWLRAMSWLPTNPAHAAAIATALLAGAQMGVLHAAARAWGARPTAASLAVAIYAGAPLALRLHTEAEVFAMNGLAAAGILWLAAPDGPARGVRRVGLLGLVAGLGLSCHLSIVLLAPLGLWGAVRGVREADARGKAIGLGVLGLALGLLPYTYLLLAPHTDGSWRSVDGLGGLVRHFARTDYGALSLAGKGGAVTAGENLGFLAGELGRAWWWLPALLGVGALVVRGARGEHRAAWWGLAASLLLAGPGFALKSNLSLHGVGRFIAGRFHLLPMALLVIPIAVGFELVARQLTDRGWRPLSSALAAVLVMVTLLASVGRSLGALQRVHSPAVDHLGRNLLATLPPDAVVVGASDHLYRTISYLQDVEGLRRDVVFVCIPTVGYDWYRARLARRAGFELFPTLDAEMWNRLGRIVLDHHRPLLVDFFAGDLLPDHPSYPEGPFARVLPMGAAVPSLAEIVAHNQQLYERYDLDYRFPHADDDVAADVHVFYARPWNVLTGWLARANQPVEDAAAVASYLAPR